MPRYHKCYEHKLRGSALTTFHLNMCDWWDRKHILRTIFVTIFESSHMWHFRFLWRVWTREIAKNIRTEWINQDVKDDIKKRLQRYERRTESIKWVAVLFSNAFSQQRWIILTSQLLSRSLTLHTLLFREVIPRDHNSIKWSHGNA